MNSLGDFITKISPLVVESGLVPPRFSDRLAAELSLIEASTFGIGLGFEIRAAHIPEAGTDLFLRVLSPENFLCGFKNARAKCPPTKYWANIEQFMETWVTRRKSGIFSFVGSGWLEFDYTEGDAFYNPNFWVRFKGLQNFKSLMDEMTAEDYLLFANLFPGCEYEAAMRLLRARVSETCWPIAFGFMSAREHPTFAAYLRLQGQNEVISTIEAVGRERWCHLDRGLLQELLNVYDGPVHINFAFQNGKISKRMGVEFAGAHLSEEFYRILYRRGLICPEVSERVRSLGRQQLRGAFTGQSMIDILYLNHIKIVFDDEAIQYGKVYFGALSFDWNQWCEAKGPLMDIGVQ